MTTHTIPADHLDAARGGVIVVDGERYDPQVKVSGVTMVRPEGLTRAEMSGEYPVRVPAEFVKLTEPCEVCEGSKVLGPGWGNHMKDEPCPPCDGSGRPILTVSWLRLCVDEFPDRCPDPKHCDGFYRPNPSFRAHVLDVVPIVASDDYRVGFDRVKVYPSGEASLFRAKPSADDLRDVTLPPGEHVGRYAVLIEPEKP